MTTKKELVRLREKVLKNGDISLYLDMYADGKRQYEFLNMHLIKVSRPADKTTNARMLALAREIRTSRELELQKKLHGMPEFKTDFSFIAYYKELMRTRKNGN